MMRRINNWLHERTPYELTKISIILLLLGIATIFILPITLVYAS